MKHGFTLIELLVVVLIIGILSSVALPQYQKAVLKSRAAEAWTNLKNINMAVSAYCLENPRSSGTLASLKNDMAVDVNDSQNFAYAGSINCTDVNNGYIYATWQGNGNYNFKLGLNPKTGYRSCEGTSCKDIGFTKYTGASAGTICLCGSGNSGCYYAD